MPDQLFVGVAPKSNASKGYMMFNPDGHARSRRKCSRCQEADLYYGD